MKKNTLLFAFIAFAFIGNAQKVYDFTGSANPGSWVAAGSGTSLTPSAEGLVLEFNAGVPRVDITRAADPFVVSDGTHMVVTLINNSAEVGSFSGFFDKNNGNMGTQFLGYQTGMIQANSPGSGVEATYVFKLQSNNYTNDPGDGTLNDTDNIANMEYVGIRFRQADGSTNLSGDSATNGNVIIKKIEIVNAGILSKTSYDFSSDNASGFDGLNGGSVSYTGSELSFTGDDTNTAPKFAQQFFSIDASSYQYVHVVVDNNTSNADQIKFQFVDGASATQTYGNQSLALGASTIDMDLSGKAEWTADITDWRIVFSNSGSAAVDLNPITISRIVFDNSPTLNMKKLDQLTFSLYPNPTSEILNIKAVDRITKIKLFDISGKQVLETVKLNNGQLNISNIKKGVYLLHIEDANNNTEVKKLIVY
ncbi:T9SS type A sorting domain-containing protein [Snuella sedimenti]|uniref:T9SS type A sorting domain-containing protein n=1 Tax=Snuella sedimenti TaxID=2798802 RepID=A0A8J7IPG0_9FLAO|nr:T9SS type A sorting domain-containing protein [Snuella sedimenti]MBJ6368517.1 T9SS type A sorting domain-containing protein [Snuella sedimenti]